MGPNNGTPFDLDAARAARREAKGDPPQITFGGETFEFPLEIDMELAEAWTLSISEGIEALFGKDQWERFRSHKPTIDDLEALADYLAGAYGFADPGKSGGSPKRSKPAGASSKRTSKGSTG